MNENVVLAQAAKKSMKKKLLIALCTVVAVVAVSLTSVLATVAYLTSSAAVSNVFTIGNVGITMTESKVNSDGTLYDGGATKVDTNTYHLVPNTTYHKDPTIHFNTNTVNELSYLFVLVRNDIEAIEDKTGAEGHLTIAQQLANKGWAKYIKASTGWVYVYVGAGNVPADDATKETATGFTSTALAVNSGSFTLFENFSVASNASVGTYGAAKITLTAVAIQQSGFATLDDAWAAVVQTYPYIHTGNS